MTTTIELPGLAGGGLGDRRDLASGRPRRPRSAVAAGPAVRVLAGTGNGSGSRPWTWIARQRAAVGGRARPPPRWRSRARAARPRPRQRHVGGEAEAVAERPQRRLGADPQHLEVELAGADDPAREAGDLLDRGQHRRAEAVGELRERGVGSPVRRMTWSSVSSTAPDPTGAVLAPFSGWQARREAVRGRHREREAEVDGLAADLVLRLAVLRAGRWPGGATSVASSPITPPMRPPLATSQTETPPQWSTLWTPPGRRGAGMLFDAALEHARGDLRAVAGDQLRREVGADVDPRAVTVAVVSL